MKKPILFTLSAVLMLAGIGVFITQSRQKAARDEALREALLAPAPPAHTNTSRVPAYQQASEVKDLGPTLPAAQFIGKTREAYEVAKKIPETLAQLPCYCECDRGYGHKSLHTCFMDDHASHCAVCVDEALLAYRLQQEEKLTPDQVRERIIAQYAGAEHAH